MDLLSLICGRMLSGFHGTMARSSSSSSSSSSKRGSLYADLEHLRAQFTSLDPDNTGFIGYEELVTLAQSESGLDEAMVPELLEKLDRDRDGRVNFEDLKALFELEREAIKRQKLDVQKTPQHPEYPARIIDMTSSSQEYDSALDTTPGEVVVSPPFQSDTNDVFHTSVVLRHKTPLRLPTGRHHQGSGQGVTLLSPIQTTEIHLSDDERSHLEPDLATQMSYLTNIPESPRLNRKSKVLSWISESEDMFEDIGADKEHTDGLLSPPMSPTHFSGDEAVHVRSILEGVCHTSDIGKDAIRKLCSHVQADQQEEQELLVLLDHLDKERKGYVSVDEFVHGLQSMRTSASVAALTPPASMPVDRPHRQSDEPIPRLSEPFSSTPNNGKRTLSHYSSTPLLPPRKNTMYGDRPQLTVLDPNNSGFVGVDVLAQQWQRMGVEPPHNHSLEEALRETLPVDASCRISVSEVITSLETAVLNSERNQTTLRQAALLTFKGEIKQLRSQLHQVSMERDMLQSTLQRTSEESKKLVQEGDEHVERITKESERVARENEQRLNERLREVEHEREEEAKRLQELIDIERQRHQREIEELKHSEEKLRAELKLAHDEAKKRNHLERDESQKGWDCNRADRMEMELDDRDELRTRIEELEQGNADLLEQNKDLQERSINLKDCVDELCAENEKIKLKYTHHKRKLQRQHSEPRRLKSAPLSASQLDEHRVSRPRSGRRPSSATRRHTIPSSLAHISEDQHSDIEPSLVSQEPHNGFISGCEGTREEQEGSDGTLTSSSEDGLFAKSTTSLLEEIQFEDNRIAPERELEKLRRENQELEESCRLLEQQLQHQQDQSNSEQERLLQTRRHRQEELERRIQILEEQKRKLSNTKKEIDTQLANTEDSLARQLDEIHRLRDELCRETVSPSTSHIQTNFDHMQMSTEISTEMDPQTSLEELEEESRESGEHSLDYQWLFEELKSELDASVAEKNQLVLLHNEKIERMKLEADLEKQTFLANEYEQSKTMMRLGKELQSSQLALEQYKLDAQNLAVQLQKLKQETKNKEMELQFLQGRSQRKVLPLPPTQVVQREEVEKLKEENRDLQEDIARKVEELERMKETEHAYQKAHCDDQLKERQYIIELVKAGEDAKSKVVAIQTTMEKELHTMEMRCAIQVEDTQHQLKASQLTTAQLKRKLESAEQQCENLLLDLSLQKYEVAQQARQIQELEEIHVRLQEEISQLEREVQKHKSQLAQQTEIEHQLHRQIQSQNRIKPVGEVAVAGVDYPLNSQSQPSPVTSPSRHSYQSDHSYHEEIVTQMKSQLEDLQMCLVQQHSSAMKSNELTLVQELIEANSTLQANVEQEQRKRERELEKLEVKDAVIQHLTEKVEEHRTELKHIEIAFVKSMEQALSSLQQKLNSSVEKSSLKVETANKAIAQMFEMIHTQHERHTSALNTLISELNQVQIVQNTYQQEVELLHSKLDQSQEELTHTEQELKYSLSIKEAEVSKLKEMLNNAQKTSLKEDEQLISKQLATTVTSMQEQKSELKLTSVASQEKGCDEERQREERELQESEMEMQVVALQKESRRAKQKLKESHRVADTNMQLKIHNMEVQICIKEQEIEELRHKLHTVVKEPVEVVMQYRETAPLENASDAIFTSMQNDLQAGRRQSMHLKAQHKMETDKMKEELDQSISESQDLQQQIYALKQAVQEQEAELRATMERQEVERELEKQRQSKALEQYALELKSAKSSADILKQQLHDLCSQLVPLPSNAEEIDYCNLTQRAQDEIATLYRQLSDEKTLRHRVEMTMGESQTEWQIQESQWLMEHEEEVQALRQRNSQLSKMLEDTRSQYQEYIAEQERENSEFLEDLITKQSRLEKELELKTKDLSSTSHDITNERDVLMDIIQQLCMEWQKPVHEWQNA